MSYLLLLFLFFKDRPRKRKNKRRRKKNVFIIAGVFHHLHIVVDLLLYEGARCCFCCLVMDGAEPVSKENAAAAVYNNNIYIDNWLFFPCSFPSIVSKVSLYLLRSSSSSQHTWAFSITDKEINFWALKIHFYRPISIYNKI